MTTADFGFCPYHGPVGAKHDFNMAVVIVGFVLLFILAIGLFILLFYLIYVLKFKDRVCPYCRTRLLDGPAPAYPAPIYAPAYYPYPPYQPQPPYYSRQR